MVARPGSCRDSDQLGRGVLLCNPARWRSGCAQGSDDEQPVAMRLPSRMSMPDGQLRRLPRPARRQAHTTVRRRYQLVRDPMYAGEAIAWAGRALAGASPAIWAW